MGLASPKVYLPCRHFHLPCHSVKQRWDWILPKILLAEQGKSGSRSACAPLLFFAEFTCNLQWGKWLRCTLFDHWDLLMYCNMYLFGIPVACLCWRITRKLSTLFSPNPAKQFRIYYNHVIPVPFVWLIDVLLYVFVWHSSGMSMLEDNQEAFYTLLSKPSQLLPIFDKALKKAEQVIYDQQTDKKGLVSLVHS